MMRKMLKYLFENNCKVNNIGYETSYLNKENISIFSPQISNESKMHGI